MFRFFRIAAVATLLLGGPALASPAKRAELAVKDGELSAKKAVLDAVAQTYGRFASLRDHYLNGARGFHPRVTRWFGDAASWLSGWEPVLDTLSGSQLASPDVRQRAHEALRGQVEELNRLLAEHEAIVVEGARISGELRKLERVPSRDLPEYEAQISGLNRQVIDLQTDTARSIEFMSAQFGAELEDIVSVMSELVETKIKLLGLDFPELQAVLNEVAETLASVQTVDRIVGRLADLDGEIALDFSAGRVFGAQSKLERLVEAGERAKAELAAATVSDSARELGLARIANLIGGRQQSMADDIEFQSLARRFASYYRSEMLSRPNGLVHRCRTSPAPTDIDCGLVRTIAGFSSRMLRELDDADLAYIEQTLERAKLGPLPPAAPVQ